MMSALSWSRAKLKARYNTMIPNRSEGGLVQPRIPETEAIADQVAKEIDPWG